ncbi:MAG: hypothetical protein KDJ38_20425, partial [Gammaproteobacteria bacterium]|nr:hypothetical protein [Gammaproteobacteria bacterium]
MDILEGALPDYLIVIADIVFAIVFLYAVITAPWYKIKDNESSHVFFGLTIFTIVIWLVRSSVVNGIHFHLLMTTTLYLMFEWQFALFAVILVHIGVYVLDEIPLHLIPANVLLLAGVPILFTHYLLLFARRRLPPNFFVFVFVNCFFAAGASMLLIGLITIGMYFFFANSLVFQQLQNFLPFTLMMSFPESVMNCIIMIGMILYRLCWFAT